MFDEWCSVVQIHGFGKYEGAIPTGAYRAHSLVSYTTFLIPLVASTWGWLLLDEQLDGRTLTGGFIILVSVTLPELSRRRKKTKISAGGR